LVVLELRVGGLAVARKILPLRGMVLGGGRPPIAWRRIPEGEVQGAALIAVRLSGQG